MRTLKKTLCLVLVLSMMVGLCAFGAFAADYTDADKIQHTDAVAVLSGMGVIKGDDTGAFNPTGTLNRAQACCLIVRALGLDDISVEASFTDLAGYGWAKSAIAICEAEGIVQGVGNGKFNPGGELTGSAWGKMLLKAIGYNDADLDDGSKWEIAVAKGVKAAGLKDNLTSFDGTKAISRDDACQMLYDGIDYAPNGKTSTYVVYDDTNGDKSYTAGTDKLYYNGTDALTALVMKQGNATSSMELGSVSEGSLGAENFSLTEKKNTDAFGREYVTYTNGKNKGDKGYVEYYKIDSTPVKTYSGTTKDSTIAADLGAGVSSAVKLAVVNNGTSLYDYKDVYKTANATSGYTVTTLGKAGSDIEVYKTASGYKAVVIDYYVWKLASADVHPATAATSTKDAKAAYVTLNGIDYETSAFKAGDVVLYTKTAAGKVITAVKAEAFTGVITSISTADKYVKIDGVKYTLSNDAKYTTGTTDNIANTTVGTAPYISSSDTWTFYKDASGNVIYTEPVGTSTATYEYLYLIDVIAKAAGTNNDGSDLFGTGATTFDAEAQAKILDVKTGEVKIVDVATGKDAKGNVVFLAPGGAPSSATVKDANTVKGTGTNQFGAMGTFHSFSVEDGKYAISTSALTTKTQTIVKGDAKTAEGNYLTNKTTLTVISYTADKDGKPTGATVTNTVGMANINTSGKTYNGLITISKGYVDSIVVVAKKTTDNTKSGNYAVYLGVGETAWDSATAKYIYYYKFSVDGKVMNLADDGLDKNNNNWAKATVYENFEYDTTKGTVDGTVFVTNTSAKKSIVTGKITKLQDEYVVLNSDSTAYMFASNYVVVKGSGNYATTTLAVDKTVTLYITSKGIEFVVVS